MDIEQVHFGISRMSKWYTLTHQGHAGPPVKLSLAEISFNIMQYVAQTEKATLHFVFDIVQPWDLKWSKNKQKKH